MTMNKINEIILGHNSFYGINHLDSEIGKKKLINQFDSDKKIIDLLKFANENNLKNLMISTVEESQSLIEKINKDPELKNDLNFFVLLPYINKYVRKTNELGIMGTLKEIILNQNIKKNLSVGLDFINFVSTSDYKAIVSNLIDFELRHFMKNNIKCVILHDSLTDILVALNRLDIIEYYNEYIKKKFGCLVGFATKNLLHFNKLTENAKLDDIYILTHVNKIGFEMNPSQKIIEETIANTKHKIICMSVLASGYLKMEEGIDYIKNLDNKNLSTVIGCSSSKHISEYINISTR